MIQKLRAYINRSFENVPKTKKSIEMQEELIANLIEKYNDQCAQGKSEEEAYNFVIASIGDLSELTEGLKERHVLSSISPEERKRSARLVAIAVMMYILSPMILIATSEMYGNGTLGLVLMFMFIAIATGLLVYNGASKPKYQKEEETMIEEFKEWKSKKNRNKAAYESLSTAFWIIVTVIYLYFSFTYGAWAYSWLIYLIASAIFFAIKAVAQLVENNNE